MSIVKNFSNHFKTITELTGISPKSLNKADSKYVRGGYHDAGHYTKGVESDHIKIFPISSTKSFAFAFYFSDSPDNPYMDVTFKEDQEIVSTQLRTANFKTRLNQFIALLKILKESDSLNMISLEKTFMNLFLKDTQNTDLFTVEIDEAKKAFDAILLFHAAEKEKDELKQKRLNKEMKENKDIIEQQVQKLKEETDFEELERKYKAASGKIIDKKQKLDAQYKIKETKKEIEDIEYRLGRKRTEKTLKLESVLKRYPKAVKDRIKEIYKDSLK